MVLKQQLLLQLVLQKNLIRTKLIIAMPPKQSGAASQKYKQTSNVRFIDSDHENDQTEFQNFTLPTHQLHQQQQSQVINHYHKTKQAYRHQIVQFDAETYNVPSLETKQNSHDFQRQFEQVRFNPINCNLMDMDLEEDKVKRPNSLLEGYDYEKFVENRCILVEPPQLINEGYITSYKLYQIKTKPSQDAQCDTCVSRRFSDFQYLNQLLVQKYGGYIIPILPEKNFWAIINLEGKQYKDVRTKSLNKYLNRLFRHKKLRFCQELKGFLFEDDAIFSSQKGQHTQKKSHLEQKIKSISSNAFEYGKSLYNRIVNLSADKETLAHKQNEEIRLSKNKLTKEDLTLGEYEIIVGDLIRTTKELKVLVQNTIEQMKRIDQLKSIFQTDLDASLSSANNPSQYQSMTIKIQNDNLYEDFEELCEFIQSCYSAIQRRNNLRTEIDILKEQEQSFLQKYKNSPRSLQLDIVRSKLSRLKKKNQTYAQELIKELQLHADQSKGMLKTFVSKFERLKAQFFTTSSSFAIMNQ